MDHENINIDDIIAVLRRNLFAMTLTVLSCVTFAVILTKQLPRKYRSKAVLNIQSSYFRNPLVSDLVSEISDPRELSAQRQSLLRLALSDTFLDQLALRYQIYKHPHDPLSRAAEREGFLKSIEYFSTSPAAFQVTLTAKDPQTAHDMTVAVLNQMTRTLIEQRYQTLMNARDAIQAQVLFLGRGLKQVSSPEKTEYLEYELEQIDGKIRTLRQRFTSAHPELAQLLSRSSSLRARLLNSRESSETPHDSDLSQFFVTPQSKAPLQEIFNDLLKKLNHLNIVLEMEKNRDAVSYLSVIEQPNMPLRAHFPNLISFLGYGLAAGLALGLLGAAYEELKRLRQLAPSRAAAELKAPLLGIMPQFSSSSARLLLENRGAQRSLPPPVAQSPSVNTPSPPEIKGDHSQ